MSHCTGKLHTLSANTCIHHPLGPSQEHPQYRLGNEETQFDLHSLFLFLITIGKNCNDNFIQKVMLTICWLRHFDKDMEFHLSVLNSCI